MAAEHAGEYKDLVVFLAAAGVLVPIFSRFKVSPVLGFLAAGVLLGPDGLGRFADVAPWVEWLTITDRADMAVLAELGVAFLLFMIGLELSWGRLKTMRRMVFGLGVAQILACTAALSALFLLLGQTLDTALVAGMALALSSTAIVLPVLAERNRMGAGAGRATFSILLAQDLAVAPLLITVTVLAALSATAEGGLHPAAIGTALLTLGPAALGVGLIVILGRLVLRPLFRSVARAPGRELFLAAALLIVVGGGVAAQAAGLSMGLGAIAGLLLAETEYRREVELAIEPFKGLLLGVFFVSVGIGLDLDAVFAEPLRILSLALGLVVIKAAVIFTLARVAGLKSRQALETALVLGPAGEFAFVILSAGVAEGVASPAFIQSVLVSATLTMFAIPLLAGIGARITRRPRRLENEDEVEQAPELTPPESTVLIVGFGRVGQLVAEMLKAHDQSYIAIDSNSRAVTAARRKGEPVYYGDAANPEMLKLCGVDGIRALVITMDAPGKVDEVVGVIRTLREDLIIIARARDDRHAERLYALGVTDAVPETIEASLQLAENTLVDLGVPMGLVLASVHERRDAFRKSFQAAMPEARRRPARALRARAPE
ncbi:LOW QUALITY PROTEIN: glutathione-regulated potassium-efflux system protein KefB [Brevundimonas abyssalis TAR-001]|uniref:Glutathione-regulated potassium-efflux system protein KefB n=1 Tax=Brevundimonas abyssalis TAR-001 TaxID=1391729 RepID=A0A8E0TS50_9CAUL|nr:LOW QUALITY PROTEIN: glutathione-regulated potassium-efflux system protein KefB [Brevundimonas abyssalis TAR-001]